MFSTVRDSEFVPPTNHDHLKDLEWLIGDWADETDKGNVARLSFAWGKHQNFRLVCNFHTGFRSITLGGGVQGMGYDAAVKKIHSWMFDFSGGFSEA
jgi:hypothetical protein